MIEGVLETCIYAEDLAAAEHFYSEVLGLPVISREPGRHIFFRCGPAMLLVFNPARTGADAGEVGGVAVPRHGSHDAGHICFQVPEGDLPEWRQRLVAGGLAIEAEIRWPRGGSSLYTRDPAGNSVELAPVRIWGLPKLPLSTASLGDAPPDA